MQRGTVKASDNGQARKITTITLSSSKQQAKSHKYVHTKTHAILQPVVEVLMPAL